MRKLALLCLVAAVVGCTGASGERAGTPPTSAPESVTTTTTIADAAPSTAPVQNPDLVVPFSVSVDLSVDTVGVDAALEVVVGPADFAETDPFTWFGSCSGLRSSVGNYSVTAVDNGADGEVESVSVVTSDRVSAPGVHDADVRVEFFDAEPVAAIGTLTLDEGLRSGTFSAFDSSGGLVEGSFQCDGPEGDAVPIDDFSPDDGALDAVEVVALLRRGDSERVVDLLLDTDDAVDVEADCAGVTGTDGTVLVHVGGDQTIGGINDFRLTADPGSTMQMRVGGAIYALDDVVVTVDTGGAAGTFRGTTADGVSIDGAFRCV